MRDLGDEGWKFDFPEREFWGRQGGAGARSPVLWAKPKPRVDLGGPVVSAVQRKRTLDTVRFTPSLPRVMLLRSSSS
jgi:hypothetical protein